MQCWCPKIGLIANFSLVGNVLLLHSPIWIFVGKLLTLKGIARPCWWRALAFLCLFSRTLHLVKFSRSLPSEFGSGCGGVFVIIILHPWQWIQYSVVKSKNEKKKKVKEADYPCVDLLARNLDNNIGRLLSLASLWALCCWFHNVRWPPGDGHHGCDFWPYHFTQNSLFLHPLRRRTMPTIQTSCQLEHWRGIFLGPAHLQWHTWQILVCMPWRIINLYD